MAEVIIKKNEEIQNVDFPQAAQYGDLLNSPDTLAKINAAEGDYLNSIIGSNLKFIGGTAQTTDATPFLIDITDIIATKPIILTAYVRAINPTSHYNAGFVRKAVFKYSGGSAEAFDQVQDIFTMRDQDYDVDFINDGATIQLRLHGLSGQTVNWNYSVTILN